MPFPHKGVQMNRTRLTEEEEKKEEERKVYGRISREHGRKWREVIKDSHRCPFATPSRHNERQTVAGNRASQTHPL
ncbi:hypothetical protein O3P69_013322 [Scylla paramamosain]|uniref:Uncharacterized protein n=1 Tax=Scylla paramamosain TaxID=85552 RepID=A0AAW0U0K6_SCYPA